MSHNQSLAPDALLVREIERLAVKPPYVHVLKPGFETGDRYLVVQPNGNFETIYPRPAPIVAELDTPYDVYTAALRTGLFDGLPSEPTDEPKLRDVAVALDRAGHEVHTGRLFLSEKGLSFVLGWSELIRSDVYCCEFVPSAPYLALESSRAMTQTEFARFLRIDLHDMVDAELLAKVRNVRWTSIQNQSGSVENARTDHSLGRFVELQVSGADKLPDELTLRIKLFDATWATQHDIKCVLELLLEDRKFRIVPFPGELEHAMSLELTNVAEACPEPLKDLLYRGSLAGA